jgi:arylsulfatase A-like enzyme
MFIRWPGHIKPLRDDETLASIIDFAPTILNLAGIKAPEKLPGLDLRDRTAMTARRTLFIESYTHDIEDLADPVKSLTARTVIDGWSKLIVPGPRAVPGKREAPFSRLAGGTELFDLKKDPSETTNLAAERPEEAARLKTMIDAWWKID